MASSTVALRPLLSPLLLGEVLLQPLKLLRRGKLLLARPSGRDGRLGSREWRPEAVLGTSSGLLCVYDKYDSACRIPRGECRDRL